MDRQGRVSFNPLDSNWSPVVADSRDASLHLAEAAALYRFGLKDEAIYLWKAVRGMLQYSPQPTAHLSKTAAQATRQLNRLAEEEHDFEALDQLTDPFPYYDHGSRETRLLSDRQGYRIYLPGKWRFQREKQRPDRHSSSNNGRGGSGIGGIGGSIGNSGSIGSIGNGSGNDTRLSLQLVYLKQGNLLLLVGAGAVFRSRPTTLQELTALWDRLQGLLKQQKRIHRFQRAPAPLNEPYCGRAKKGRCALLQSSWLSSSSGGRYRWEYYHLWAGRVLIWELRHSEGQLPPEGIARYLLENLHLSSN